MREGEEGERGMRRGVLSGNGHSGRREETKKKRPAPPL